MGNSQSLETLVGENLTLEYGSGKWSDSVAASDGCVYGIPANARRVIKFNPADYSITVIGMDLGDGEFKWTEGVEANNGCIYVIPYYEKSILKINIHSQVVEKLDAELPESDVSGCRWGRGALGDDGCLYFYPYCARRMLKIDPSNDTVASVGIDFGEDREKYAGTVKTNDGYLVGMPENSKRIVKFNPYEPDAVSIVGKEREKKFKCSGTGALAEDGNIYGVSQSGKILKIDLASNSYSFVAKAPQLTVLGLWLGWHGAIAGKDGNIYFPPCNASRLMKYDITTKQPSFVGEDDFGNGLLKYLGGTLNPIDGRIYCLPMNADRVLSIVAANIPVMKMDSTLFYTFDAFLTHDWGKYADGTDNHKRVAMFNHALKKKGMRTWFDEEKMQGNIFRKMASGISDSMTVIVFVTKNYIEKVDSDGNDNCKFEFEYSVNHKTVDNMIPVVMEDVPSPWKGQVGLTLGSHLWYSFKSDDELQQCVDSVVEQILLRRK